MLRIEMIGNLTKDPESRIVKTSGSDVTIVNFTVAASHGYGEYKHTEFIRVAAWRGFGENCLKYLRKGSKVYVAGTPSVNAYVNKDGNAVGNIELQLEEIEFLNSKPTEQVEPLAIEPEEDVDIESLL